MFLCQECFHNIPRIPAEQLIIFTKKQYSRLRRHFRLTTFDIEIKFTSKCHQENINETFTTKGCWSLVEYLHTDDISK